MIVSMTGYGQARAELGDCTLQAEVRSVNGRFLKLYSKLPSIFSAMEKAVEPIVREHVSRGTVDVMLKYAPAPGAFRLPLDVTAARGALEQLRTLKNDLGLAGEIDLKLLLELPGVMGDSALSDEQLASLQPEVEGVIRRALEDLVAMRSVEGEKLAAELRDRVANVRALLDQIEARLPLAVAGAQAKLKERIGELLDGTNSRIEDDDLAREIAILVDRSDVSEELVRCRAHCDQLLDTLANGGEAGKKLEFLAQEMHRESSTTGAKSSDAEISKLVVDLKAEVEKIREQVMNIE